MSDRIALSFSTNLRHPFLIASREGLGNLKQKVQSPPLSDYYARLVAWLTEHADQPLPDCPPGGLCSNFSDFDARAHLLSNMALSGAVAWWCDGNSKWLQAASAALAKLAEWEYWRSPWHLPLPCDLTSGFTSMGVGLAYDLLYEQLDEPLRVKVQDAIIKHGTTYIMPDEIDRQWWSYAHDGNWSYHTSGNLGLAALSIYPERPEVLPAIETAAGHIERSLDHIHPDGGWREGPGYGIGTMQSARLFIDALANAGDGQLAAHPGPSLVDDFFLFTMITPDRQAYFGDCGVKASVSPVLYRQAALGRRGDLQYLADQCGADGPLSILWRDPTVIPQPPHFEPASRYWPQCNWAVLRSSWEDPYRVVLATKAGTTAGGHQHPDCGTFLLSAYGKELISEPGIGTYSRDYHRGRSPIKSSTTHNCLLFDGKAEQVAREFKGGVISQFVTRPTYDAIKMELTNAYDYADMHQFNRFFFLLRPDLVVMVDEIHGRNAHYQFLGLQVESRLHTWCDINVRNYDAVLSREGAALLVKPVLPPYTPGLGDHSSRVSVGEHEGLQTRHPDQNGPVRYLRIETELERNPTVMVTLLVPGRDVAEAEGRLAEIEVQDRRRRRLEVYYAGQTLVLDWGNRRWQLYWNVLPGRLPRLIRATVGGPST